MALKNGSGSPQKKKNRHCNDLQTISIPKLKRLEVFFMKSMNLVLLLVIVSLGACGSGNQTDSKPIQGVWNRDDAATLEALAKSTIPREFVEENSNIYFGTKDNVIEISGTKLILPNWGVSCDFTFNGEEVSVTNCPKEGNDGALTAGLENYFFAGGKLLSKDIDGNVIAVFVKASDLRTETRGAGAALAPPAEAPTSESPASPPAADLENNPDFQIAVENCREAGVQEAEENSPRGVSTQMMEEISQECIASVTREMSR